MSVDDSDRSSERLRFDPAGAVSEQVLRRIMELATHAPSGFHLQPWRFIVVRDARNRRSLRGCAFNHPAVGEAPVVVVVLGYLRPHRTHLEPLLAASLGAGVLTAEQAAELRGRAVAVLEHSDRHRLTLWATRSAMLAAATLMLAAEAAGLGTLFLDHLDDDALRNAFGIPDDHIVCGLLAMGYAADQEPAPAPARFSLSEVCHQEHFGQPWTTADDPEDDASAAT